jgi:hypothetical protein
VGENGFTYYVAGLSVASVMGFLILVSIICCIVKCCKKSPEEEVPMAKPNTVRPSPRIPLETNVSQAPLNVDARNPT